MEGNRAGKSRTAPRGRSLSLPNDVFDSHPSTPERIRMIEDAAGVCLDAGADARAVAGAAHDLRRVPRRRRRATGCIADPPLPTPSAEPGRADQSGQPPHRAATRSWPPAFQARGELYMRAERYSDAVADFDKAITLEPGNPQYPLSSAAPRKRGMRDLDGAIADFTRGRAAQSAPFGGAGQSRPRPQAEAAERKRRCGTTRPPSPSIRAISWRSTIAVCCTARCSAGRWPSRTSPV